MRLIAVVLAGWLCATGAAAQVNPLAERTQAIAVLVLGAQKLNLKRIGLLVFGNAQARLDVPDDRLAHTTYEAVRTELELEGRYRVKRIVPSIEEVERMSGKAFAGSQRFLGRSLADLAGDLKPYRERCDCDALLVVGETTYEVQGTNQYHRGITWLSRAGVGAALALYLVDPQSGKTVADSSSDNGFTPTAASQPDDIEGVLTLVPDAWSSLEAALTERLRQGVRRPLHFLGLRPSCTQFFYEWFTPERSRNPVSPDYRPPPPMPAGADPQRCR
jgi:hypothetical protein